MNNHKSTGATPGPQVPSNQVPPPPYPSYAPMQPYYHSKGFTQQQLDEINASDYVCMTGNISHTLSTNTPFQTTSAKSYERAPATGIAGAPTKPQKEPKKCLEKLEVREVQCSKFMYLKIENFLN